MAQSAHATCPRRHRPGVPGRAPDGDRPRALARGGGGRRVTRAARPRPGGGRRARRRDRARPGRLVGRASGADQPGAGRPALHPGARGAQHAVLGRPGTSREPTPHRGPGDPVGHRAPGRYAGCGRGRTGARRRGA
ncbi:hypothetical protein EJK15_28110 [Nonomuraea basaltis]|nr:hypothetical protein EJK15_28110 [Nonomuraea basaltis]